MRKVIQIAMDSHPRAVSPLHALCDDGSIWLLDYVADDGSSRAVPQWRRYPDIPQDDPPQHIAGSAVPGERG